MLFYDIVIIDSGLNIDNTNIPNGICICENNGMYTIGTDLSDPIGHGTVIYSILKNNVESKKIFFIKIFNNNNYCDTSILIEALKYIKNNIQCKIVNISLGSDGNDQISELYKICQQLADAGVIIVSAFDNNGSNSYPASFDCVIGVDSKKEFVSADNFDYVYNSPVNVLASGNVQRVVLPNKQISIVRGSSIACAYISAMLANDMNITNLKESLNYLKTNSKSYYPPTAFRIEHSCRSLFSISNASVFPFSKEVHAFLRFSFLIPFKIHDYYDIKQSGKVGVKLSKYYDNESDDRCIKDINKLDLSNIDTIILGHLDHLNSITHCDYREKIIKKSIENKINIYSFDPLDKYGELLNYANIKYYYPSVNHNDIPQNTFGKLYKIYKPVVGIFGTSSKQGKFSLQLTLKNKLETMGYNVGTIGTEPHSLLFGCDNVFPMGYNSTISLTNDETILFLNDKINQLSLKGKDIIIVSTQAQIIPFSRNNLLEYPKLQYHFALGVNPDAIVLCVNYFDEIEYIRKSIFTITGLTDSSLIALVVYPLTYTDDWKLVYGNSQRKITEHEFIEKKDELEKNFGVPVYLLGNEQHMQNLRDDIINFF